MSKTIKASFQALSASALAAEEFNATRVAVPGYASYQLIRNVLAAYATGCSFCVIHDERRPDLREEWFQIMAADSAQSTVSVVTYRVSTSPFPIVVATDTPAIAPMRLKPAAITTAWRGVRTRVETHVAIELAVSWKPLMYSNTNATMRTIRINSTIKLYESAREHRTHFVLDFG